MSMLLCRLLFWKCYTGCVFFFFFLSLSFWLELSAVVVQTETENHCIRLLWRWWRWNWKSVLFCIFKLSTGAALCVKCFTPSLSLSIHSSGSHSTCLLLAFGRSPTPPLTCELATGPALRQRNCLHPRLPALVDSYTLSFLLDECSLLLHLAACVHLPMYNSTWNKSTPSEHP